MKKLALLAFGALASSAFAGQPVVMTTDKKPVVPMEPCFTDNELQLDTYAVYNWYDSVGDGMGGGLALNYYFHRYIGFSVDGNVSATDDSAHWNLGGNLLLRWPLELGSLCLAPYIKGGGGVTMNGDKQGFWTAGGGLEFRVTPRIGIYGEGSYNWAEGDTDFAQARLGVRWVF